VLTPRQTKQQEREKKKAMEEAIHTRKQAAVDNPTAEQEFYEQMVPGTSIAQG
jgi:hypothetical protein